MRVIELLSMSEALFFIFCSSSLFQVITTNYVTVFGYYTMTQLSLSLQKNKGEWRQEFVI